MIALRSHQQPWRNDDVDRAIFGGKKKRGPVPPGFPVSLVGSTNFMRLFLMKAAHATMAGDAQTSTSVPGR
jgi:hypothetical protein